MDIQHPQFTLQAEQLSLALNDSDQGKQTLHQILAQGNVHVASRGQSDHPPVAVSSDQLTVDMARDGRGNATPTDFHARGNVRAQQVDQVILAGILDVGLAPADVRNRGAAGRNPSKSLGTISLGLGGKGDGQTSRLAVRTIHAQDHVDIQAKNPGVHITADRVDGDLPIDPRQSQEFQLQGNDQQPAQLVRDDGSSLTGQNIFWSPTTQKGYVPGPGTLVFISTPPVRHATATQPAGPAAMPNKVILTWKEAMHFDNVNGTADFAGGPGGTGGVEIRSISGRDTADMTSDVLHADFVNENTAAKAGITPQELAAVMPPDTQPGEAGSAEMRGGRAIRTAAARGHVRFHAESWPENTPANSPRG